jgi:hypothetical protein
VYRNDAVEQHHHHEDQQTERKIVQKRITHDSSRLQRSHRRSKGRAVLTWIKVFFARAIALRGLGTVVLEAVANVGVMASTK